MNGSSNARSKAALKIADWLSAQEQKELLSAKPVRSDASILVVPESQINNYVSEDSSNFYYRSIIGA